MFKGGFLFDSAGFVAIDETETDGLKKKIDALETRVHELIFQLADQDQELEALRPATRNKDRDHSSLREIEARQDQEILWLKTEIRRRDQRIAELEQRAAQTAQRAAELSSELAKRDAQVMMLVQRGDSQSSERLKVEANLGILKEELAQLSTRLVSSMRELDETRAAQTTLQSQVDAAQLGAEKTEALEGEATLLRARLDELEKAPESPGASGESDRRPKGNFARNDQSVVHVRIIAACENGTGPSQLLKMKIQRAFHKLGSSVEVAHMSVGNAKSQLSGYHAVFCPVALASSFETSGNTLIVGIKNILSEEEIEAQIQGTGLLDVSRRRPPEVLSVTPEPVPAEAEPSPAPSSADLAVPVVPETPKRIIVTAGSDVGMAQLMKMKVTRVFRKLGFPSEVAFLRLDDASIRVPACDAILCPAMLTNRLEASGALLVVGIDNVLSEEEIESKIRAAGLVSSVPVS